MLLGCALPIMAALLIFVWGKLPNDYWLWLVILLCPLVHIVMMRSHGHNGQTACRLEDEQASAAKFYTCPECGLRYADPGWAKKCEAWCRKYQSCNLAITKHAVKD